MTIPNYILIPTPLCVHSNIDDLSCEGESVSEDSLSVEQEPRPLKSLDRWSSGSISLHPPSPPQPRKTSACRTNEGSNTERIKSNVVSPPHLPSRRRSMDGQRLQPLGNVSGTKKRECMVSGPHLIRRPIRSEKPCFAGTA